MTMIEDAPRPAAAALPGQDPGSIIARAARSGMWSMAGSLAAGIAAFAVSVIVARSLAPAPFGSYAYLMWVMRTVSTLLAFGIPMAVARFVSSSLGAGDPGRARGTVRAAFRVNGVLMPVAFAIVAAVVGVKAGSPALAAAVAAAAALLVLSGTFDGILVGHRRFDRLAKALTIGAIAQVALIALGAWRGASWRGFVLLQAVAVVVGAGVMWRRARGLTRGVPASVIGPQGRRAFGGFAAIMGLQTAVDLILWGRPEIFFLERWRPGAEVGFYSVALALAALTAALPFVGARAFFPEFSWLRGGGHDEALRKAFPMICTYLTAFAVPLSIIGAGLATGLIHLIYGPKFLGASGTATVLMAGSLLGTIGSPSAAAVFAGPKPSVVLRVVVVLAASNLLLDWALIPRFGMAGGAAASIVSQGIAVALVVAYGRARLGLRYPVAAVAKLCLAGGAGALVAHRLAGPVPGFPRLAAAGLAGGLVYLAGIRLTGVARWADVREILRRRHEAAPPRTAAVREAAR